MLYIADVTGRNSGHILFHITRNVVIFFNDDFVIQI